VATDQPFYTVDEPEFRQFVMYSRHPSQNVKIPHRDAVKRRIMKMGDNAIDSTVNMFKVSKHPLLFTITKASLYR